MGKKLIIGLTVALVTFGVMMFVPMMMFFNALMYALN